MKNFLLLASIIITVSFCSCSRPVSDKGVRIMAYYFPQRNNFNPEILPLDKLTHIIFSFTEVIGNEMKFQNDSSGIMLKKIIAAKKSHPNLKVMIACGGWAGSGGFPKWPVPPKTARNL